MVYLVRHYKKFHFSFLLSFLIPVFSLGIVFALFGISPFGAKSLLIKDLYWQYVEYYNFYYDIFLNGKSLFYSWEAGLGMNFFGIFGYYLSSFFSPIVLLFGRSHLPEAIIALTLFKVGCSGLTISIYFAKGYQIKGSTNVIFSIMYALMSYVIVYAQNIMWLDGIIYMPLILLGIEYLLKDKLYGLLTIALALMFISNFYISYMVGLFSFLYFLARYFAIFDLKPLKPFLLKLIRFAFVTLLAVGISAIVVIPTYLALKETVNPGVSIPWIFDFLKNVIDIITKLYFGMYDSIKSGLPNIYIGILPLLLFPLFFSNKRIVVKERLVYAFLIAILVLSFEVPLLNIVWHAFDNPDSFPYRYSFILSFLLLTMAIRVFVLFEKEDLRQLNIVFIVNVLLVILLQKLSPVYMDGRNTLMNLLFLCTFFILLYGKVYYKKKQVISVLLVLVVVFDLSANALHLLRSLNEENNYKARAEYRHGETSREVFKKVQQMDPAIYRMESETTNTFNDAFRYDYKGVSHFSSMTNGNIIKTTEKLGYTRYLEKWMSYKGNTLVADSIIGIKYIVNRMPVEKLGYEKVDLDNNIPGYYVYKNTNSLPLGFMMNSVQELQEAFVNPFQYQEDLLKSFGNDVQYYTSVIPNEVEYKNLDVTNQDGQTILTKKIQEEDGIVRYTFNLKNSKQLYLYIDSNQIDLSEVLVNGHVLSQYPGTYSSGILDLGMFIYGETTVELKLKANTFIMQDITFKTLNVARFESLVEQLRKQPFEVDEWSSSSVKGHINAEKQGIMFMSIPYDRGWTIRVDDKKVEPLKIAGSFIGFHLSEGEHKIEMSYVSPGFKIGAIISSICLVIFMICMWVSLRKVK